MRNTSLRVSTTLTLHRGAPLLLLLAKIKIKSEYVEQGKKYKPMSLINTDTNKSNTTKAKPISIQLFTLSKEGLSWEPASQVT